MSDLEPFTLPAGIGPADAIEVITELLAAKIRGLEKRVAEIEANRARAELRAFQDRLTEIEKRGVDFLGVYQRAQAYRPGSMVTSNGSLWIAITDIPPGDVPPALGQPGTGSRRWQLAARSGRDGKDAGR